MVRFKEAAMHVSPNAWAGIESRILTVTEEYTVLIQCHCHIESPTVTVQNNLLEENPP